MIPAGDTAKAGALGDVIATEEDTNTTDADEDADDLGRVVAHMENDERDYYYYYDCPEVDKLGRENGSARCQLWFNRTSSIGPPLRVSVGEDDEVISFNVQESKNKVFPTIVQN